MDFTFTDEQEAFRQTVRDFIKRETSKELDREIDREQRFPAELSAKMADAGFFALPFPVEYGGAGGSILDFIILAEELAYGSEAAAACFLLPVFFAGEMIALNGSEEQKQQWIPRICAGEVRGCFALTEPDAGSDAAAITTHAERSGDGWVVNGYKHFISGADVADYLMTVTRTDPKPDKPYNGITIFMVPRTAAGVTVKKIPKMGNHAISLCEIWYEDVHLGPETVVGGDPQGVGAGWGHMWNSLDLERIMVAILYTSIAQKAFDDALERAKTREQFGQPIGRFQAIQHQLATMKMEVDASRLLAYRAAWLKNEGLPCAMEGAEAKIYATEMCLRTCLNAMQIFGGYGYTTEVDVNRYVRDALLGPIGMGTNHIQRNIIAKLLGLF